MPYCHKMIADVAKAIARRAYDTGAHCNLFYAQAPDEHEFVREHWKYFIEPARKSLAGVLAMPDASVSDSEKKLIFEALSLDNGAPRG